MDATTLFNCCTNGVEPDWSRYANLELCGCINTAEPDAEETAIEGGIERDDAEFFTIYGRLCAGECEAITDCKTFEDAESVGLYLAKHSRLSLEIIC